MRRALPSLAAVPLFLVAACQEPAAIDAAEPPSPAPETPAATAPALGSGAAPSVDDGSPQAGVLKTVSFPGGDLTVPASWNPKVRNDPPMTSVHVMPAAAMTCDLALLEGHGTAKQAEEYLAAGANAYNGSATRAPDIEVGGHVFQGIHVTQPKALPDAQEALVEVYAAITGDDLVGIGVTRLEKGTAVDEGRRACLQAFAQLTSTLPRAKPVE